MRVVKDKLCCIVVDYVLNINKVTKNYDWGYYISMKALGFINPNNYYPSPVIAIAGIKDEVFCVFPNGEEYKVEVNNFVHDMKSLPDFIPQDEPLEIAQGESAFAVNATEIIIADPEKMHRKLSDVLERNNLTDASKGLIKEFLQVCKAQP